MTMLSMIYLGLYFAITSPFPAGASSLPSPRPYVEEVVSDSK